MINARMETVATKPAYRDLIPKASRRALQLADGYFEWLKPEQRGEPRQPFYFQVDGGVPFAFAALWTPAKIDGEWIAERHAAHLRLQTQPRRRTDPRPHARDPRRRRGPARLARLRRSAPRTRSRCAATLPSERLTAHAANPAVNKAGDLDAEGPELLCAPA